MGKCYSGDAYDQLLGRVEEQTKLIERLRAGKAELQSKVDELNLELETKSKFILTLESSLQIVLDKNQTMKNVYEERIKQMEWNFNDTISKFCDLQIEELTRHEKINSKKGLNTKTSAKPKLLAKKEKRLPSLLKLFGKKNPPESQVLELKKKFKVLELDQTRKLHRKENELTKKQEEAKNLESKLKVLEMNNRELKEAIPTPCSICLDNINDCTFIPCGHLCTCMSCAKQVTTCPLCRRVIKSRVKVFQN